MPFTLVSLSLTTASSKPSYHLVLTRARPSDLTSQTPVFSKLSCTFLSSSWSTVLIMLLPNLEIHHVLTASQFCVSSSWIFNRTLHLLKVLLFLNLHLSKCQLQRLSSDATSSRRPSFLLEEVAFALSYRCTWRHALMEEMTAVYKSYLPCWAVSMIWPDRGWWTVLKCVCSLWHLPRNAFAFPSWVRNCSTVKWTYTCPWMETPKYTIGVIWLSG